MISSLNIQTYSIKPLKYRTLFGHDKYFPIPTFAKNHLISVKTHIF